MTPWTALLLLSVLGAFATAIRLRRSLYRAQFELRQRDRERRAVVEFLGRMGESATNGADLGQVLELIVEFTRTTTKADAGAIFLKDDHDSDIMRARVVQGLFPPIHTSSNDKLLAKRKYLVEKVKKDTLRVGEGIVGLVAKTGEALLIPAAADDPRVPKAAGDAVPLEGLILAPLTLRSEILGVLVLVNKRDGGRTFDEVDRDLVLALANQAAVNLEMLRLLFVAAERQRIENELRLAHDFQALMLPRRVPEVPGLRIAGISRPAAEVGGDYYDFIDVDHDHLGIVIADVSGKGIPGGLVMATTRSVLRAEARGELSPRKVLRRVNDQLALDTKENVFVTVTYGILDRRNGAFRFSRAGHEPLLCCDRKDQKLTSYSPNGMAVGLIGGEIFDVTEEMEINLSTTGTATLYTDGVVEAMNEKREEYGERRLHATVQANASKEPGAVIEAILADIERFTGGVPQHDDITLVVLEWDQQAADQARTEVVQKAAGE